MPSLDETEAGQKLAAERQVNKFGSFLEEYGDNLDQLRSGIRNSLTGRGVRPVGVEPGRELAGLSELTSSDNKMVSKVALVMLSLLEEIQRLVMEGQGKLLHPILVYGEGCGDDEDDSCMMMARLLPHLQQLVCFTEHCRDVVNNLLQQLAVLLGPTTVVKVGGVRLSVVWESLGDLLVVLTTLDSAVVGQVALQEHWRLYKKMVKGLRHEPDKFGAEINQVRQLEKLLLNLEDKIVNGSMLATGISSIPESNKALTDEMGTSVRALLMEADSCLCVWDKLLPAICLAALHHKITRYHDKKLVAKLWDSAKKAGGTAVVLPVGLVWLPEEFLIAHLPHGTAGGGTSQVDKKLAVGLETARKSLLQGRPAAMALEAKSTRTAVSNWVVNMEAGMVKDEASLTLVDLTSRADLLLEGLKIGKQAMDAARMCLCLHSNLNQPLAKTLVIAVASLVMDVKTIEDTFHRHATAISTSAGSAVQHCQFLILTTIQQARKSVVSDKKYSQASLDVLSNIVLAERALSGPGTQVRHSLARLTLAMAAAGGGRQNFREEELKSMAEQLVRMKQLSQIGEEVKAATDTTFMFWHRDLLPTLLADLYTSRSADKVQYLLSSLTDCVPVLLSARHLEATNGEELVQNLRKELEKLVQSDLVKSLCQDIETELRLTVHQQAGLKLDDRNPFRAAPPDLLPFLRMSPLEFLGSAVSVQHHVESYLERTFYNLTTVSLHNWRMYGEMRQLADKRFGLSTVEDHLPVQTLEQGLDVLEIMRNIQVFTAGYNYNMNNQVFVEKSSNNKFLNTINIGHIANSIRTHGAGIMNTTINFTYQFLRRKFAIFSQFLYDEHIKSRLTKDMRYFRDNKKDLDQKFPFDRAVKFNRGIRKLGLMADGVSTYLDQFRMLVTNIGNAMGFVRMVRSGGLHATAASVRFIPDLEDIPNFEEITKAEGLSEESIEAAEVLDSTLETLTKHFNSGSQYFELLVQVFCNQLNDEKQSHLKNFYLILPPLTVNYIEHITAAKDKMNKKNVEGASFTDDGFAMGVAYCLTVLDQWRVHDSLHWFESVSDHLTGERARVEAQRGAEKDDKLQQTLTLTLKRLDTSIKQFQLLYFSCASARIFFQGDSSHEEEDDTRSTVSAVSNKTQD